MADIMVDELFHIIQQASNPLSLSEIIKQLDHPASERTIRRALLQLVMDNKITKLGDKRGTRYELTSIPIPSEISYFSHEAILALSRIQQPIFNRDPIGYQRSLLDSYIPGTSHYLSTTQQTQLETAGNRDNNHLPAGTFIKQIYNRFLIDLSYNSSRLEGNTYSLLDTERLILQGEDAEGKLDEETIMVLNHKEAIRYLVDNAAKLQLTSEELFTLHYLLADGLVLNKYAGKIRDSGVRISASVYMPIENQTMLSSLLNEILHKARMITNAFEQSIFLLAHVAYLQPFIDVNKRTSRLIANIPLIKNNLVPLSFNDVNKEDYIGAMLAVYECQNLTPLADLYCHTYLRACKIYNITMESAGNYDALRVKYRLIRREIIRNIITHKLIGPAMENEIEQRIQAVPSEHRDKCRMDIHDDLAELAPHRIVGLGVSQRELQQWLQLK